MIPAEAIEAACSSFFRGLTYIHPESKADMCAALEAAAPQMLAEAWDEGLEHMAGRGYVNPDGYIRPDEYAANPYRSHP